MKTRDFLRSGHWPTLLAAFFYFDMSFMVWIILGPLAVQIAHDLDLDPAEKGLMVALPVLAGAFLRVVNGYLVDRLRPRLTGILAQVIVIAGLLAFWHFGIRSYGTVLALGLVLGLAGASFAVALPLASRWYPPKYQGVALGIAGAGNSGTVFAALFAPMLAAAFGWSNVIGLATIPLALALIVYLACAKDSPDQPPSKSFVEYARVLRQPDAWWFMFYYAVTFGGFSGLASSLGIYFNTQYGLDPVTAGYCTAGCVFAGSLVRPLGGAASDRFGGVRMLTLLYGVAVVALVLASFGFGSLWAGFAVLLVGMLALGMGNGAVFQLVPQRFRAEIGVMTGLVGMTGGVGGFYLASSLGFSRQITGSYQAGFLIFATLAALALAALTRVKRRWRATWIAEGGMAAARI
ncbi:nitrate/nitrite transporter [Labrys monachus]|uniref:NNP family nitrate/nitrite transporter-like MFS transporter n=1 Tax=Labrys monachus TaxID=217067 RepID=A0ABU0FL37_9HYPH|nr:nitrate/nitrite transporter [Labrys monachus]MDQ0395323.1 NNP family nitrate/nitrite transporter-like MFS transporter [Labrys monachus]